MVCCSKGSVLINKSPCGFFSSSFGLRQGDPLSPYLFILAEEILSLKVERLRLEGSIAPISSVSSTPCHLLYADDILLFLKAHKPGLRTLQSLLRLYQDSLGQNFNLQKSQLFIGDCNVRRKNMVSGLLQINPATLPSVYVGVPLFFGSARHGYFNKIMDFFSLRVSGWKAKCFSFAGRLILVKHVLSSIPIHISLVLPLHSRTRLLLERLMRNFIWSFNPAK
ncbi:hypothetical protein AAC387_Pa01g2591 [Persea americana]